MRRLTPGRGPSSRPGQLCAVEETPSQKLDSLSRNRRLSRASSIPARRIQTGCPIEKPILQTGTKKNQPTRRRIDYRATPREKGGLVFFEVFSSAAAHEFHLAQDYTKGMLASSPPNPRRAGLLAVQAARSATTASMLIQTIVSICRRTTRRSKSGAGRTAAIDI